MFKVINLNDKVFWKNCWLHLPAEQRSVYLLPEYYEIYEKLGHGEANCVVYQKNDSYYLYPFLKRNLKKLNLISAEDEFFDIEGAYGLNGAAAVVLDNSVALEIETQWEQYCQTNRIIAEFTRFNPMFSNHRFSSYLNPMNVNQAVVVDLKCKDLLYESYEHSVRKNIKKAVKNNVRVRSCSSLELSEKDFTTFTEIYYLTMDRNNATDFYYFSPEYFRLVKDLLPQNSRWFFASVDEKIVSVELVLFDETVCFSFLGGTLPDYFPNGSNVLLKHEIILYFQQKGLSSFFLGGGISPDDGIYKYKRNFAKNSHCEFYIGKKVHLRNEYNLIVSEWEKRNPEKRETYKNFLLKYWH